MNKGREERREGMPQKKMETCDSLLVCGRMMCIKNDTAQPEKFGSIGSVAECGMVMETFSLFWGKKMDFISRIVEYLWRVMPSSTESITVNIIQHIEKIQLIDYDISNFVRGYHSLQEFFRLITGDIASWQHAFQKLEGRLRLLVQFSTTQGALQKVSALVKDVCFWWSPLGTGPKPTMAFGNLQNGLNGRMQNC